MTDWLNQLDDHPGRMEVIEHAWLHALQAADMSASDFAYFVGQWYHLIAEFCPFLAGTLSRFSDPHIQTLLSTVLYQELGSSDPERSHLQLFVDTFRDAGLDADVVSGGDEPLPTTRAWIDGHREAAKSPLRGLGFVYGTEMVDLPMVAAVGRGATRVTGAGTLPWVDIHIHEEPDHTSMVGQALRRGFTADEAAEITAGAVAVWSLWRDFFTGVRDALAKQNRKAVVFTMQYDHREIEARWRAWWKEHDSFRTPADRSKPKYYILDMFPYPSGSGLHVGHPKGYVATDIVARARRMMGYNVLRPMGWDSFGLPAERQAAREGKHPAEITQRNIATFKSQLDLLGLSYDWSRELATSDSSYYKWTQWIFLKLYEKGLAYKASVPVNWCPALGTVLANEEVVDGRYVETGDIVERRLMTQWMLRITQYAESLLAGLDELDWPEGIKTMQRDWIGRSDGARISFAVADDRGLSLDVFTTRPDTLFGCTYVLLAPEHPLITTITSSEQREAVEAYVKTAVNKSERDRTAQAANAPKTGVFTGAHVRHPITGAELPIWVADYVLARYGTGAVFACPAHDERDHAFATAFGLRVVEVVAGGGDVLGAAFTGDGPHVNSDFLDGLNIADAKRAMIDWLERNQVGEGTVQYRLRDWLFSRQRYWGEPFPMIELEDGTTRALSEADLPIELPEIDEYLPTEDGESPLARAVDWVRTTDPVTGVPARRETNTMPQWAGSCWYYLRFISPHCENVAWDPDEERYWMPVDLYVGGAEHAVLHLLYARFWHHVLHDLGLVTHREPFKRLFNQGMVHATSYREQVWVDAHGDTVPASDIELRDGQAIQVSTNETLEIRLGRYRYPSEVEARDGAWVVKETGVPCLTQLEKMSKSRYNVENPDDVCHQHGADALRLYELFMGPLETGVEWSTAGVAGTRRFLAKVFDMFHGRGVDIVPGSAGDADVDFSLHGAIKMVTESILTLRFNTAISQMMIFVNTARKLGRIGRDDLDAFLRILAPFAPHLGEELWRELGHDSSIGVAPWPEFDPAKLNREMMVLAIQVNGRVRSEIQVSKNIGSEEALALARADEVVSRYLEGKEIKREILVPGRLINFVVGK